MKKQSGDARSLGTCKAVLAVAVGLYAAMAGAQTNAAPSDAPLTGPTLVLAQTSSGDCPVSGFPGCRPQSDGVFPGGHGGIAAASVGTTASAGPQGGNGTGTSSAGLGSGSNGGVSNSGSGGLGSGSTGSGSGNPGGKGG